MILRIIMTCIACLLIGAHFLRVGLLPAVAVCLLAPLLLMIRRRWSLIVLQVLMYLAALLWILIAAQIIAQRIDQGRSYRGVIIILGSVAAFTVLTGLLLNSKTLTRRYAAHQETPDGQGPL